MRTPAIARSNAQTYAAGNLIINPSFLTNLPIAMLQPEVRTLWLRIKGTIHFTGNATVKGSSMLLELVSRLLVTDASGEKVNMSGASWRQWAQRALGGAYVDPPDVVAGGGGAQDITFDWYAPFPFETRRGAIPTDFRVPTADLTGAGAQITLSLSAGTLTPSANAATVTAASTTFEFYAEVVDAGHRRSPSRVRFRDIAISSDDFNYPVKGLLMDAWYSRPATDIVAGTTTSQVRNFISDGLAYLNYANTLLDVVYKSQEYSLASSDDIVGKFASNIYCSMNEQSTMELPDLNELQVKMDVAHDTGSVLVLVTVTPRTSALVANALGVSQAALQSVSPTLTVETQTTEVARPSVPVKQSAFLPLRAPGGSK